MNYSNIPLSSNSTTSTIDIDPAVFAAIKSFFTSRDFGEVSAETITLIIIRQSKKDSYNPMQILDTLRGLNSVELSGLVSEILNYNRFKSSSLGYAQKFITNSEVARNIIA